MKNVMKALFAVAIIAIIGLLGATTVKAYSPSDTVYSLYNMHLYSEKSLESEPVTYVLRGDELTVLSVDGEWIELNVPGWIYTGWCLAESVSAEDVDFIPEYSGTPTKYLFESLINESCYLGRFPKVMLSKMNRLNMDDYVPVYMYDNTIVDYGYSAQGIESIEDIKALYRNFFTEDKADVGLFAKEKDMGFQIINGKYYFNDNYGIGWNTLTVEEFEQISPESWRVRTLPLPIYEVEYNTDYIIVLEDGKYKIDGSYYVYGEFRVRLRKDGVEIIGYEGIDTALTIPQKIADYTVVSIGAHAFDGCEKLRSVSIPNTVTEIGARAFFESGIESIMLPDSVTFLGDGAFQYCYGLETVTLSNNIKSIGYDVFDNCESIKSLVLPKNLKEIGAMNFCGCSMELKFTGSAPSFKEDGDKGFIFYNSKITKVYYPANDATWTKAVRDDLSINSSDIIWIPYTAANTDIQKFSDGKWYYTVNGKKDLKFTGFANNANGRYRIEKGVVNFKYTDVVKDENQWRYYNGGKWQVTATTIVKRSNGTWWYVKNGVVQFITSVVKRTDNNTWWYVKNGQVQFGFTGFADNSSGRWRIEKGQVNSKYNDIVKDGSQWRFYSGGKWQTTVTTIAKRSNGTWWYVKNGVVQFNVTSVVKRADNTWWYVKGGQVQTGVTSVVKRTEDGTWWYVKNGQVQTGVTSIVKRTDNNTWWYVKGGKVQFDVTGVVKRADNNTWWYVKDGKVQFGVTSVEKRADNDTWWYVKGGQVQFNVTNVVKRTEDGTWWYVMGGKVQTDKTGLVKRTDNNTWWYIKSGKVQFDYNGVIDGITIGTHKYELTLSNGKLVSGFPDETFAFDGNYVMSNGSVRYYIENKALYTQDAGSGKKTRLINLSSFFSSDTKMTLSYAYKNYVYLTYTDWDNEKVATYVFNTKNYSLKKIANDIAIVEYYGCYAVTYSGYLESEAISDISLYKINSNGSLSKMKTIAESGFAASCIDNKLFYLSVSYNNGAVWTMCSCNYDGTGTQAHGSIPYYAYFDGNNTIDGYLIDFDLVTYQYRITRQPK